MKITRDIKPPLGVIPYEIYFSDYPVGSIIPPNKLMSRLEHLSGAMIDYAENNRVVDEEWIKEYNVLIKHFEDSNVFLDIAFKKVETKHVSSVNYEINELIEEIMNLKPGDTLDIKYLLVKTLELMMKIK